jgi:hypothetical protein
MQALGGTAVAALILVVVDQDMNGGRYSGVVAELLRHTCTLVGVHF